MRNSGTRLLSFIYIALVFSSACSAATIYVKYNSQYNGPGNDWAHAYHSIQAGLNAASSGDEVWVAAQWYHECITLKDGVALYGGFAGTETSRGQRDWTTRVTTIDQNFTGSNVTSPPGATTTTRLDGFMLSQGHGVPINGGLYGMGVYCDGSSPTIVNNTITGNGGNHGNGIFCRNSSAIISNNVITTCKTSGNGGGIYCESSSLTIANNIIIGNTAGLGGGIYCKSSSPIISGNTITNNIGGVCCDNASPALLNNNISGNQSDGLQVSGGSPMIANNVVAGNVRGIWCRSCSPTLANNTIVSNQTTGLQFDPGPTSSATCANNIVAFNFTGLYRTGTNGTFSLSHNCLYGNTSHDYSGISAGLGDISTDPGFAGKEYCNLHLQPGSPCIDSGDNSAIQAGWTDIDGQARTQPAEGTVDIGADESDGTHWSTGPYAIIRVKPDGNDSNDGSTWALAKKSLQAGIDAACLKGGEVWVKAGKYTEIYGITIRSYAYVYGGFNGTEAGRSQRNWAANATFIGEQVVIPMGNMVSAIDGFRIAAACIAHYPAIQCTCSSPLIANNSISSNGYDGINCQSSSPTIVNNVIKGNGGAGISGASQYCKIIGNTIVANDGEGMTGSGGLIANNIVAFNLAGISTTDSSAVYNNCEYGNRQDTCHNGGGNIHVDPKLAVEDHGNVHIQPDSPCVGAGDNSVVQTDWLDLDCQARVQPVGGVVDIGADESDGTQWPAASYTVVRVRTDGIDANDGSSWLLAKQSVQAAIDDVASKGGGEVWVKAGVYNAHLTLRPFVHVYGGFAGIETSRSQRNWMASVTILDGQASWPVVSAYSGYLVSTIDGFTIRNGKGQDVGGGICVDNASIVISHNVISGNIAGSAGGILCQGCSIITDNVIAGNSASSGGGGVSCEGNAIITNNTFANNVGSAIASVYCSPTIANNIVCFNGSGIRDDYSYDNPALSNNCVYSNGSSNYIGVAPGTGDISADPLFVNAAAGDYHLRVNSPCIDVGSDAFVTAGSLDVYAKPRIFGPHVDIGADERCDKVDALTFTPDAGGYSSNENVVVGCITQGATIHYTTDGTDPTEDCPQVSSGSYVRVDHNLTLKAKAWKVGWGPSDIKTADYTIDPMGVKKQQPNNASVQIGKAVVTYVVSTSQFYIESDDRCSGTLVYKVGHGMTVGMRADLVGTWRTLGTGEKYVNAPTVTQNGTGTIAPLLLPNKSVGGGDWYYDSATGAGQKGVSQYSWDGQLSDWKGLNDIGLLITIFGKVTYSDSGYFYIDDGSQCRDNSGYVGVKVLGTVPVLPGVDPVGKYVKVTGISSCFKGTSPDTSLYRQIRAAQVTVIQ